MSLKSKQLYEFGRFRLDAEKQVLWHADRLVPIQPKALATLAALVRRHGDVVTKDELLEEVWADSFVEESNLSRNVHELRKILSEFDASQKFIATVPRRGYRFTAEVHEIPDNEELVIEREVFEQTLIKEISEDKEYFEGAKVIKFEGEKGRRGEGEINAIGKKITPSSFHPFILSPFHPFTLSIAVSLLILLGVGFAVWLFNAPKSERVSLAQIKSIAVLPLHNLSEGEQSQSLALGLTDALINRLGRLNRLQVRSLGATQRFAKSGKDAAGFGADLQVDAVLESTLQTTENNLRVSAKLINVPDGRQIWAETFDAPLSDVFRLQDEISERVATALMSRLTDEEKKVIARSSTPDAEAYRLYLKGAYFMRKGTPENWKKSVEYFREAVARDNNYAQPYANLAVTYLLLAGVGELDSTVQIQEAKKSALRAIELDDQLPLAHLSLGHVAWSYDWNWALAEKEFRRAIELNPSYASAHNTYSHFLTAMGRHEEAIAENRKALELDPVNTYFTADLGWTYLMARRFDEAEAQNRAALEMDKNSDRAHLFLGWICERQGKLDEAIAFLRKARELSDDQSNRAALGHALAIAGREREARELLEKLSEKSPESDRSASYFKAVILAGLNDKTRALENLEDAHRNRMSEMVILKTEPRFDSLREEPRFQEILKKMNLQ